MRVLLALMLAAGVPVALNHRAPELPRARPAPRPQHYGAAVAAVTIATAARWLLTPLFGEQLPFLTFYPAVAVAAWYGGLAPGVLATGLSAVLASWVSGVPDPVAISGPVYWIALAVFVLMNLLVSVLSEQLHVARWQAFATAETVRRSDVRGRRLFESNIIGVVFWEEAGRITDANDAFLALASTPTSRNLSTPPSS